MGQSPVEVVFGTGYDAPLNPEGPQSLFLRTDDCGPSLAQFKKHVVLQLKIKIGWLQVVHLRTGGVHLR